MRSHAEVAFISLALGLISSGTAAHRCCSGESYAVCSTRKKGILVVNLNSSRNCVPIVKEEGPIRRSLKSLEKIEDECVTVGLVLSRFRPSFVKQSVCYWALTSPDNSTEIQPGLIKVPSFATCLEGSYDHRQKLKGCSLDLARAQAFCYCRGDKCNKVINFNNTEEFLRRYGPRSVDYVDFYEASTEPPEFVYSGYDPLVIPNPGLMIAAVLISMSLACLLVMICAYSYFRMAKALGLHPKLMRKYRPTDEIRDQQVQNCNTQSIQEKLLSIHYEESSSRDSGIPTTVLHDSLEVSTAHSPTSSRTASTAATSRYYSDNIRFDSVIGQGRFSTVWKVKCLNEPGDFCVKEFNASETSPLYQSKHVIRLLSSVEHKSETGRNSLWLVLPFYQNGDLQQYLKKTSPCTLLLMELTLSLLSAVEFIHSEKDSFGCLRMPMAHRDIKSSNILVNDCGKSVILADFGLSMRLSPDMYSTASSIGQAGTSRYMSPELLDRYSDLSNPESFKQVDLYALSLVIWEILNRSKFSNMHEAPEYAAPYSHLVCDQPSKEIMRTVVVSKNLRPRIRPNWTEDEIGKFFVQMIVEMWEKDPESRLPAGSARQRLEKFYASYQ
ncbi:Oidioi.mRNA.OKI2018_I69.PAR.g12046.t1.cds [Oikopleura dioica]|uniref:receptor protein serine/threonine kinase n=1 Tax=Oikopleura dioica TaxID=34765 RepID=A0ABN7RYH0_OIKDI|nr:Oidioi.mRNA.OKI2018_I69.PAR.g12046.t1.cds [Oikopleura dioica]